MQIVQQTDLLAVQAAQAKQPIDGEPRLRESLHDDLGHSAQVTHVVGRLGLSSHLDAHRGLWMGQIEPVYTFPSGTANGLTNYQ